MLNALLDLYPVPPRQAWKRQRRQKCALNRHQLESHEPCSLSHAWKQGAGWVWINTWIWSSTLQELACCQPHKAMLEALGGCRPGCVSICHAMWNTQIQSFSPSAVFQVKRLQVWQLWNELLQKPEKLNEERKQCEMGICCNIFPINLTWNVVLSKFRLCHVDLACKNLEYSKYPSKGNKTHHPSSSC